MDTGLVIFCVGMTVWAWYTKKTSFWFIALMAWLGFTAYMNAKATGWDYYRMFMWVGIGMAILSVIQAINVQLLARRKGPEPEPDEVFLNEYDGMVTKMNRMRSLRPRKRSV